MVPIVVKRNGNFRRKNFSAMLVLVAAQIFTLAVSSVGFAQQPTEPAADFGSRVSAATDRIADSLGSRAT